MGDDPGGTHVTVFRGIPSTRNTPALDPILLYDGRAPTLQEQALAAIHDHYQNTVEPTTAQLDAKRIRTSGAAVRARGFAIISTGVNIVNAPNNPIRTLDHQRRCEPGGDDPVARSRAPLAPHARPAPQPSSGAPAIRGAARLFCEPVQDPDALGASRKPRPTSTTTAPRRSATPSRIISGSSTAQDPVGSS
jgi:hypothetical protein